MGFTDPLSGTLKAATTQSSQDAAITILTQLCQSSVAGLFTLETAGNEFSNPLFALTQYQTQQAATQAAVNGCSSASSTVISAWDNFVSTSQSQVISAEGANAPALITLNNAAVLGDALGATSAADTFVSNSDLSGVTINSDGTITFAQNGGASSTILNSNWQPEQLVTTNGDGSVSTTIYAGMLSANTGAAIYVNPQTGFVTSSAGNGAISGAIAIQGPNGSSIVFDSASWSQIDTTTGDGVTVSLIQNGSPAGTLVYDPYTGTMSLSGGTNANQPSNTITLASGAFGDTQVIDGLVTVNLVAGGNTTGILAFDPITGNTVQFPITYMPAFSINSDGSTSLSLSSSSGVAASFDLGANGISTTVDGQTLQLSLTGQAATVDASGNITLSSELGTVTIPVGGSIASFALNNGTTFDVTNPQSISDDGNGNLNIAASDPFSAGTANLLYNGNTGDLGFSLIGSNGTLAHIDLGSVAVGDTVSGNALGFSVNNSSGQQLQALQTTSDGGYTTTMLGANGTSVSHYNQVGQLTSSTATDDSTGNYATTNYSTDPDSSWYAMSTAYNSDGQVIASSILNRDGSQTVVETDPVTGGTTTIQIDDNQNITSIDHTPGTQTDQQADYNAYARAVADTVASQLISKVLITNDLPASIAATAFTDAVISDATGSSADFSTNFTASVFNIAGGIAGSDAGVALAKLLGLPSEIGSITGGVAANLVSQYLVQQAGAELNIDTGISGNILSAANFELGFVEAGGSYLGSQLANLIVPTNLGGEVTGAITTVAVTTYEASTGLHPVSETR